MDLPIRSRLFVRASNRTVKACSTASDCVSNPMELNLGSSWSSESRPAAAAAVHVRSQDGWGLPLKKHKCVLDFISTRTHIINPMVKIRSRRGKAATDTRLSLCMAEVPGFRDIQERSSSPQIDFAWSCYKQNFTFCISRQNHNYLIINCASFC
jgi:hypothetical protein